MYYSEYLPRINSISVLVDFDDQTVADITKIEASALQLGITTKKNHYSITLPTPITNALKLTNLKSTTQKCLSVTMAVPSSVPKPVGEAQSFMAQNSTKWSCKDLQQKTPVDGNNQRIFTFSCGNCDVPLVQSSDFKFMDMPSEFWYEMMDFWHCHKPHNNHSTTKDYSGVLKPPNDSTVMIGSHYLLLNKNDRLANDGKLVKCSQCGTTLGDVHETSLRINKWELQLHYKDHSETFSPHLFIYNSILDKINSLATRKFKFYHSNRWWYLWIMNVGLDIAVEGAILNKAMKILYFTDPNDDSNFVEEYELLSITSPEIILQFTEQLEKINSLLPQCIKTVEMDRKWNVGYLAESGQV
ncbi:uncharacterized protein CANTADRAFT_4718 [Suhomyces tanzawaensis NRRL Y-17324]|uniref:Ubiquitin-conjugating enzyme E2-binding protein n=1 Tax=Suhomyces tanzawaensis NRRL Y-17324 TaxID=984487 RepID=A0A1E4SME7_9ASCO|nr:uncharacterized protein CANTADRAFT_4718 [Suhomyces tanzawaensis NRRL Y-17324]ODV80704.1 hypothetical protein CANTADRAFT_4718 [Suhomyces tanzawaensis NRRL Y-17324]